MNKVDVVWLTQGRGSTGAVSGAQRDAQDELLLLSKLTRPMGPAEISKAMQVELYRLGGMLARWHWEKKIPPAGRGCWQRRNNAQTTYPVTNLDAMTKLRRADWRASW